MKFHIGDLVTRPMDVHGHDYDNKRAVRIKGVDEPARIGPHTLIGTIIDFERDHMCMKGMDGQEHTHEITYDVVWRNWVGGEWPIPRYGHVQRGFLEHGLTLVEPRMYSITEIRYVANNMNAEIVKRKLSKDPMLNFQGEQMYLQLNALGWVVKRLPYYLAQFQKGGNLDTKGE